MIGKNVRAFLDSGVLNAAEEGDKALQKYDDFQERQFQTLNGMQLGEDPSDLRRRTEEIIRASQNFEREQIELKARTIGQLENGMEATAKLYVLGLRTSAQLERYKAVFDAYTYKDTTETFIRAHFWKGEIDKGLDLLEKMDVRTLYQKAKILAPFIFNLLAMSKLKEALAAVARFNDPNDPLNSFKMCSDPIMMQAKAEKQWDIYERGMQLFTKREYLLSKVHCYVEELLRENLRERVCIVLEQHRDLIDHATKEDWSAVQFVFVYVDLGMIERAWEFAERFVKEDPNVYLALKNAFESANMPEEMAKAEALIPKAE